MLNIIVNHFINPSIFVLEIYPYTIDSVFVVNALSNEHSLGRTTNIVLHRHCTPPICHQPPVLSERNAKLALKRINVKLNTNLIEDIQVKVTVVYKKR